MLFLSFLIDVVCEKAVIVMKSQVLRTKSWASNIKNTKIVIRMCISWKIRHFEIRSYLWGIHFSQGMSIGGFFRKPLFIFMFVVPKFSRKILDPLNISESFRGPKSNYNFCDPKKISKKFRGLPKIFYKPPPIRKNGYSFFIRTSKFWSRLGILNISLIWITNLENKWRS